MCIRDIWRLPPNRRQGRENRCADPHPPLTTTWDPCRLICHTPAANSCSSTRKGPTQENWVRERPLKSSTGIPKACAWLGIPRAAPTTTAAPCRKTVRRNKTLTTRDWVSSNLIKSNQFSSVAKTILSNTIRRDPAAPFYLGFRPGTARIEPRG